MKYNRLTGLRLALLTTLIMISLLFACGCEVWDSSFEPTQIEQGFSPELLDKLKSHYGISIPEQAQFIKGYNCPGFRDSFVAVQFAFPISGDPREDDNMASYLHQLLQLGTRYGTVARKDVPQFTGAAWYAELGGQMQWMLDDKTLDYTHISYNIEADRLVVRFVGWRPGASFA